MLFPEKQILKQQNFCPAEQQNFWGPLPEKVVETIACSIELYDLCILNLFRRIFFIKKYLSENYKKTQSDVEEGRIKIESHVVI